MTQEYDLFLQAVAAATDVPETIKAQRTQAQALRRFVFDPSLASMLESQIAMSTRGEDFTNSLRQRLDALKPFLNQPLIKGRIDLDQDATWLYVLCETGKVIFWEHYPNYHDRR